MELSGDGQIFEDVFAEQPSHSWLSISPSADWGLGAVAAWTIDILMHWWWRGGGRVNVR